MTGPFCAQPGSGGPYRFTNPTTPCEASKHAVTRLPSEYREICYNNVAFPKAARAMEPMCEQWFYIINTFTLAVCLPYVGMYVGNCMNVLIMDFIALLCLCYAENVYPTVTTRCQNTAINLDLRYYTGACMKP